MLECQFRLKEANDALFLDFQGESIYDFRVNGTRVDDSAVEFSQHKIQIPKYYLKPNQTNSLRLKFTNTYVTNSAGLHRFEDPYDKEVYLYTHLEPYFCHRWFPCFDQPSLRGRLTLTAVAPEQNWQVVANDKSALNFPLRSKEGEAWIHDFDVADLTKDQGEGATVHSFEESPPIGTYIFGLFAGPYHSVVNDDPDMKDIPMRVYARPSKLKHADHKEIFRVLKAGIRFYEELFSCKFPFKKYDTIFCPEFRIGAMENVGAISFNEIYLKPADEMTENLRTRFYYVVLHELSHMWFGDMVSMQWWDNLWLKESFADFCSGTCMAESPELRNYKNPERFFLSFLTNALEVDIASTTHPIRVPVPNTTDAVNVFDNISYSKGASFLKQLDHFVGRDILKDGIKFYMEKYQFKNTKLEDFISCLQRAMDNKERHINLQEWTDSWLTTSGINFLSAEIEEQSNGTFSVHLKQGLPKHGDQIYREQVIDVVLYDKDCNPTVIENVKVKAEEKTPEIAKGLESKPCAILVNANNKGYCRVILDKESAQFLLNNVA